MLIGHHITGPSIVRPVQARAGTTSAPNGRPPTTYASKKPGKRTDSDADPHNHANGNTDRYDDPGSLSDIGDPDDRDRRAAFLTVVPRQCAPGRPRNRRAAHRDLGLATKTASVSAKPGAIVGGLCDRLTIR